MSQTFFSKQDAHEKHNRLSSIAMARGQVTLWIKGTKEKRVVSVSDYDKERSALVLQSKENIFPINSKLLCTFELRGMNFFGEVTFQKSIGDYGTISFLGDFFKSERRNSFRLMTFPQYDVWAEFNLGDEGQGGNVIGLKNRVSQTGLFKNFLKLVNERDSQTEASEAGILKIRVQDISTTGLGMHIGELEKEYFPKDQIFEKVSIRFSDAVIEIPKLRVMYVAPYIGPDKNLKQFKVGIQFEQLPINLDEAIGKKINQLLRSNDHNKDFENFIK